jgi:teichuronic acid biosynthesis glycosyltransferase TuaC
VSEDRPENPGRVPGPSRDEAAASKLASRDHRPENPGRVPGPSRDEAAASKLASASRDHRVVGVVTTSYPRGADDWAGGFVRARVRALVAGGAQVEVVAAGEEGQEAADPGVRVIRVPTPRLGSRSLFYDAGAPDVLEGAGIAGMAAALAFAARMATAVSGRAGRWGAVESHWLAPCGLLVTAAAAGRPHRAFAHGGDVALLERLPAGEALARKLRSSGAALSFVSRELCGRFARLCGVDPAALAAVVEPAALDGSLFQPLRPGQRAALRRGLGCTGPTVLAVGRMVPVKGFDLLVRAVGRLPRNRRPALILVGAGPERERLASMAAARKVVLRQPGSLPPAGVAAWMGAADVYVQPSRVLPGGRSEGSPLAVREALSVGLPVIATSVGGLAELADLPGRVQLVPPEDPAALAAALATALQ